MQKSTMPLQSSNLQPKYWYIKLLRPRCLDHNMYKVDSDIVPYLSNSFYLMVYVHVIFKTMIGFFILSPSSLSPIIAAVQKLARWQSQSYVVVKITSLKSGLQQILICNNSWIIFAIIHASNPYNDTWIIDGNL